MIELNYLSLVAVQEALANYVGDAEEAINEVLHNFAGDRAQEEIKRLIPVSGKTWKGKAPPARTSNSLQNIHGNLSETVTTTKKYQYLYFPDDGTNTRRHVGNQRFFERGGDAVTDEIIERCLGRLTNNFE